MKKKIRMKFRLRGRRRSWSNGKHVTKKKICIKFRLRGRGRDRSKNRRKEPE